MAHALGLPFQLVQRLTSGGGGAASGLSDADFPTGTVQLRRISASGASPASVSFTGGVDFVVEEMWALTGVYAFKFGPTVITEAGIYAMRIQGGPGSVDELIGVLRFERHLPESEMLWLSGKNTVGVTAGYDAENNPTAVNVYGFHTAADAELFIADPSAHGALVRYLVQENYQYDVDTGRPSKYIRKVP